MHEAQLLARVRQHVAGHERVDRRRQPGGVDPRQRRGEARVAAGAQHGRRRGELDGVERQAREQRARDRRRAQAGDRGCRRGIVLGEAARVELGGELAGEERVAAAGGVQGGQHLRRGNDVLPRAQLPRRLARQRLRQQAPAVAGGRQLGERPAAIGGRARGDDEQDRQVGDAAREVRDEAQRRQVGPLRVVDRDQQRAVGGQVGRHPPQRVQGARERRVRPGVVVGSTLERRERRPRRSGQQRVADLAAVARDRSLDELAHDRPRDRALELVADRPQAAEAAQLGQRARIGDEPRLADARRALDDEHAAATVGRAGEGVRDVVELALALQCRGHWRAFPFPRRPYSARSVMVCATPGQPGSARIRTCQHRRQERSC